MTSKRFRGRSPQIIADISYSATWSAKMTFTVRMYSLLRRPVGVYDVETVLRATRSGEKFCGIKCCQITISGGNFLKVYTRALGPDAGVQSGVDCARGTAGGFEQSNTLYELHKVLQLAGKLRMC